MDRKTSVQDPARDCQIPVKTIDRKLTVGDLSLEYHVPIKTIYHWRASGIGPTGVLVGRRILFAESGVDLWFNELAAAQSKAVTQ